VRSCRHVLRCAAQTEKLPKLQERLHVLLKDITESFYTNVSRGLFEKDKLLYSFMITVQIERNAQTVSDSEWR
jgi:dynein heavy chain